MKTYYIKYKEEFTAEILAENNIDAHKLLIDYQTGEDFATEKGVVQVVVDKFKLLSKATEKE